MRRELWVDQHTVGDAPSIRLNNNVWIIDEHTGKAAKLSDLRTAIPIPQLTLTQSSDDHLWCLRINGSLEGKYYDERSANLGILGYQRALGISGE